MRWGRLRYGPLSWRERVTARMSAETLPTEDQLLRRRMTIAAVVGLVVGWRLVMVWG